MDNLELAASTKKEEKRGSKLEFSGEELSRVERHETQGSVNPKQDGAQNSRAPFGRQLLHQMPDRKAGTDGKQLCERIKAE